MTITFRHAASRPARADVIALGVTADAVRAGDDVQLGSDAAVAAAFLTTRGFEGALGQTVAVPGPGLATVVLVGLGDVSDVGPAALRRAGAAFARAATRHKVASVELVDATDVVVEDPARAAAAVVEGIRLASYRYRAHKSAPAPADLETVTVVSRGGKPVARAVERAAKVADAVCWARDLVNEPGGTMTPRDVVKAVRAMARRERLKVSVMEEAGIRSAGLGGLLGVNRGSEQPPRFVTVSYTPSSTPKGRVALVGKGITFDSGGLSLKPAEGMMTMKGDMGGAAAVFGAMAAIAAVAPPVAVTAYVPLTDNMTGGDATRPGDVLTIRGGTTVEVLNTDAEGRLVLADALVVASEAAPDAVVDVATLTGACMVALGNRMAGLMGHGEEWLAQVEAAADRAGEPVWRLPLPGELRSQLDSKVADLKNIGGGRHAGALVAGLFLREFVGDDLPWAHLDIAGPGWSDEDRDEITAGGTGFGVRLLLELLDGFEAPATA